MGDQICVHLAPGGVKAMKGEIAHFKSRLTKCSEQIKEAQDALSEAILSRQDFLKKVVSMEKWLETCASKAAATEEASLDKLDLASDKIQALKTEAIDHEPLHKTI